MNGIISKVNAKPIAERRLKVVVDPGNERSPSQPHTSSRRSAARS